MKLNEGEIHEFQVLKLVELAEEGNQYLLRHSSGRRLLLPFETYKHFDIKPGGFINCRIDKVNCTGKVFLEPEHPIYKEGNTYSFEVIDFENNEDTSILVVKDYFGFSIKVPYTGNAEIQKGNLFNLRVERIKKGIPILSFPEGNLFNEQLKTFIGKIVLFQVVAIGKNFANEEVYQLLNEVYIIKSQLKVRHFKSYGIEIGKNLLCHIYGVDEFGFLRVEPQNPYYKVGESYDFQIIEIQQFNIDDAENQSMVVLEDVFGNKCGVSVKNANEHNLKEKTQLNCRVLGFRKGKPKLEMNK